MNVIFRVDSGKHIGIGHVMRCLTLAHEVKKYGFNSYFITKDHIGSISGLISKSFPVHIISGGVTTELPTDRKDDYSLWLGESWLEDLKKTNEIIDEIGRVDMAVIDHYALDAQFESHLNCQFILSIDDLTNRNHYCDFLLNQNITAGPKKYNDLIIKEEVIYMMGPRYAILREEFQKLHNTITLGPASRTIKRILVFYGGTDVNGDCLKTAKILMPILSTEYDFYFILNSDHKDFKELNTFLANYPKASLLTFVEDIASLMTQIDLFIGAGGSTSLERASLGVATAILCVSDNQKAICEELSNQKIAHYLGLSAEMSEKKWLTFFREIVPDTSLWYNYRCNSFKLVDGQGTKRVAHMISQRLNGYN